MVRRSILNVALVAAGLVVGAVGGFLLAGQVLHSQSALGEFFATAWAAERASYLYHNAKEPEAREALEFYEGILDTTQRSSDHIPDPLIQMDRAITLGRLALLDEKVGDSESAQKHMQQAVSALSMAGWRQASEERIRSLIARMEENARAKHPIPGA